MERKAVFFATTAPTQEKIAQDGDIIIPSDLFLAAEADGAGGREDRHPFEGDADDADIEKAPNEGTKDEGEAVKIPRRQKLEGMNSEIQRGTPSQQS